jgi:hypothetical protein
MRCQKLRVYHYQKTLYWVTVCILLHDYSPLPLNAYFIVVPVNAL